MATINYKIRSSVKGRLVNVVLRFREGRNFDCLISTGLKVFPEYWSNKKGACKGNNIYTEDFTEEMKVELDHDLGELKTFVLREYNSREKEGEPLSRDWLRKTIDKFKKKDLKQNEDLNQYIDRYIKEIESGDRLYSHNNKTGRYKFSTIKNYKNFQVVFNDFQKAARKNINFENVTVDLYDELMRFFNKQNYGPNTAGRHIKTLKVIMRAAREERLHNNTEIDRKKFKAIKAEVQSIYLTESEVNRIREMDLSDNLPWDQVRDVFLVGVYTAQRFSDYSRISGDNIRTLENGRKVIDIIQEKTGEQCIIPIRPELEEILRKYDYSLPKVYEQKVNARIKKIGKKAKINEQVQVTKQKDGFTTKSLVPKYDMIMTHTARRTGCTLMYLAGIPSLDIMKISGHKTEREFLGYIKVSKEETATNLSGHAYFTGSQMKAV